MSKHVIIKFNKSVKFGPFAGEGGNFISASVDKTIDAIRLYRQSDEADAVDNS